MHHSEFYVKFAIFAVTTASLRSGSHTATKTTFHLLSVTAGTSENLLGCFNSLTTQKTTYFFPPAGLVLCHVSELNYIGDPASIRLLRVDI